MIVILVLRIGILVSLVFLVKQVWNKYNKYNKYETNYETNYETSILSAVFVKLCFSRPIFPLFLSYCYVYCFFF